MRILQKVWQDIRSGQNFDIYTTIAAAAIIAFLGIRGVADQTVISSAILATLALVSGSLLINRHENEEIRSALSRIESTEQLAERFLKREWKRADLIRILPTARKAFFWGLTLSRTVNDLDFALEKGLRAGLEVRFLIIRYDSSSTKMAAFRNTRRRTKEQVDLSLHDTLSRLAAISSAAPSSEGKLEARWVDYLPPYTIIAIDPHLPNGRILVRLTSFRIPNETRPTFELTRTGDRVWFDFFVEQFESVWRESDSINLDEFEIQVDSDKVQAA